MNIFTASSGKQKPILFIINGESNSGGYALNSQAPSNEIGQRDNVQILNNTTLLFETLNIGSNNLIGHAGMSNNTTHGMELEIANRRNNIPFYKKGIKIIKTGQGGSTISEWNTNGSYYTTFKERIDAVKGIINLKDYKVFILFSLGINDAASGTNINTWKSGVIQHFQNLRNEIGSGLIPIIMTEFQGMGNGGTQYNSFNTAIQEIAANPNVYSVNTASAGLRDVNHWDYYGMKYVTGLILDVCEML